MVFLNVFLFILCLSKKIGGILESDGDADWEDGEGTETYGSEMGFEDTARMSPIGDLSPRLGRKSMIMDLSLSVSSTFSRSSDVSSEDLVLGDARRSESQNLDNTYRDDLVRTHSFSGIMDKAKPQVTKIVQGAKNIVKRRVERLANA
jgi:hypothetical protein